MGVGPGSQDDGSIRETLESRLHVWAADLADEAVPAGLFLQRKKHNHKPYMIILENLYMALVEKRNKIARF